MLAQRLLWCVTEISPLKGFVLYNYVVYQRKRHKHSANWKNWAPIRAHTLKKTFETGGNESQTSKTMGNEKVRLK